MEEQQFKMTNTRRRMNGLIQVCKRNFATDGTFGRIRPPNDFVNFSHFSGSFPLRLRVSPVLESVMSIENHSACFSMTVYKASIISPEFRLPTDPPRRPSGGGGQVDISGETNPLS